jgi:hypothetical protein
MTVPWSGNAGSVLLSCEDPPVYPKVLTVLQILIEILTVKNFFNYKLQARKCFSNAELKQSWGSMERNRILKGSSTWA